MPYNKENKNSKKNINYLNKDFDGLKTDLINYTKSYFPNTYRDFNETSTGMMLLEMSAYVGDVLSFYIDQNFKETMLSTVEERRNVINLAKSLGYKVKPIIPSIVDLRVTQEVGYTGTSVDRQPNMSQALVIDKGMLIQSSQDSSIVFETLDTVDFTAQRVGDPDPIPIETDTNGLTSKWRLVRYVRAVSGKPIEKTFVVDQPQKFLKLTLAENNVINILDVTDGNGNKWYEVDYLAQSTIFTDEHYISEARVLDTIVPEMYKIRVQEEVTKRFISEIDENNQTSLVFGNGITNNTMAEGNLLNDIFNDNEDISALIQSKLPGTIDPLSGIDYSGLGEVPANTTLTIKYRVGGGLETNVQANDLNTINYKVILQGSGESAAISSLSVNNTYPARGGMDEESVDSIKENTKTFFASQNRAVTKEDYEARTLSLPSRYGSIAKVYADRANMNDITGSGATNIFGTFDYVDDTSGLGGTNTIGSIEDQAYFYENFSPIITGSNGASITLSDTQINEMSNLYSFIQNLGTNTGGVTQSDLIAFKNVHIFLLSYDKYKNLVSTPNVIKDNVRKYLSQFKILSDDIEIRDGFVINFGVFFRVSASKYANKSDVKLRCINAITEYFDKEKMQFNQAINLQELEAEIYRVEGVNSVTEVTLTQDKDILGVPLHLHANNGIPDNGVSSSNPVGYAYGYDFDSATEGKIIKPAHPATPAVFELKNPNDNVKGVVE